LARLAGVGFSEAPTCELVVTAGDGGNETRGPISINSPTEQDPVASLRPEQEGKRRLVATPHLEDDLFLLQGLAERLLFELVFEMMNDDHVSFQDTPLDLLGSGFFSHRFAPFAKRISAASASRVVVACRIIVVACGIIVVGTVRNKGLAARPLAGKVGRVLRAASTELTGIGPDRDESNALAVT